MNGQTVTLVWMMGVVLIMLSFGLIAIVGYVRLGRKNSDSDKVAAKASKRL